jgi:peptidoglycan hydrolase-like protein with peptidoglycan-binding domain
MKTQLSLGDRGKEIAELQAAINTFGFTDDNDEELDEDGVYGRKTSEAISKFQSESNLKVDGVAGISTIESILSFEERNNEKEREKEADEIAQGQTQKGIEKAKEKGEEEKEVISSPPEQPPVAPPVPQAKVPTVDNPKSAPAIAKPTEDPLLQQPQTTAALKRNIPQGDDAPSGMDPAIQQKATPKPKARPIPQWSDTLDGSDGRIGGPTPLPDLPKATAGNHQKFAQPAKKSPEETPASTDNATIYSKGEEQPETPADQTDEPTPREVPVQAYTSRQAFRTDLNTIYNKFKKIVLSKTHDGMDEIQSMIHSSAQRIKGQTGKYPGLSKYLLDLEKMRKEWMGMELGESAQLSEGDFFNTVSSFFGGDDESEQELSPEVLQMIQQRFPKDNKTPQERFAFLQKHKGDAEEWLQIQTGNYKAPGEDEKKQAREIADKAVAFFNNTIEMVGWNEEEIPPEGHPQRDLYINVGDTISNITNSIGQYQTSANHKDLLTVEKQFSDLSQKLSQFQPQTS